MKTIFEALQPEIKKGFGKSIENLSNINRTHH